MQITDDYWLSFLAVFFLLIYLLLEIVVHILRMIDSGH